MTSFQKLLPGFAVILLSLLSAQLSAATATQSECRLQRLASVEFVTEKVGVVVPVSINGREARAVVELASPFSQLWATAARSLTMKPARIMERKALAVGRQQFTHYTTANSVTLGGLTIKNLEFLLRGDVLQPGENFRPDSEVALLGLNVFDSVDVEFDMAGRKMNLYSQEDCAGSVVYWTDSYDVVDYQTDELGVIHFPMRLDGRVLRTTLSTLDPFTELRMDAAKQLYGIDAKSDSVESVKAAGGRTRLAYQAMTLTARGLDIINAQVALAAAPNRACSLVVPTSADDEAHYSGCYGPYPLRLGMNTLSRLHLYFATREKRLYFTAANAGK